MQLELYQWLVPALSIFYIIRTIRQYTKGKYSPRNTVIWLIFWTAIALLGIMPNEIATSLAEGLGFRDRPNAIIFVALGALFLLVFYLSAALNRVENQLTDLVRKLALNEALEESVFLEDSSSESTIHLNKKLLVKEKEISLENGTNHKQVSSLSLIHI